MATKHSKMFVIWTSECDSREAAVQTCFIGF